MYSIQGQICGMVNQTIDHVLAWGLGAVVKRRKDINMSDPVFMDKHAGFELPNCTAPCDMNEMIVVDAGRCDPDPALAYDVELLNGLQLTWLAFEFRKMGFDSTFSFQSGFWLPQTAHWLFGMEKQGEGADFSLVAAVDARPKEQIIQTLKEMLQSITVTEGQWSGIQKMDGYPSDARSTMAGIACPDSKGVVKTVYEGQGCQAANETDGVNIEILTDEQLLSEWQCARMDVSCANLTTEEYSGLCQTDEEVANKCKYTCNLCDFTNSTQHAFTVAGLMDAVLDMMLCTVLYG